ncbi:MAG TPA: hypothetical protein VG944_18045 [Fimbriimonas sp.]|nr:hypothetical protein [Fimbriimonas sp.]
MAPSPGAHPKAASLSPQDLTPPTAKWHHRYEKYSKPGRRLVKIASVLSTAFFTIDAFSHFLGFLDKPAKLAIGAALVAMLLLMGVLTLVARFWITAPRKRATRSDFALVEDPGEPIWVVELSICSGRKTLGQDRGVLGFHNGAMFFNGRCCSFQIGSQDLKETATPYRLTRRYGFWIARALHISTHYGERQLWFELLRHPAWKMRGQRKAFDEAMGLFTEAPPTSELRSLPPCHAPSQRLPEWRV